MGLELSEKKKREYLIAIIQNYLETNLSLMNYYHAVADTRKAKLTCNKSIRITEQAITHLRQIKHVEILEYLYSTFMGNNIIAYSMSGSVVMAKKLQEYDTETGIVEFRKIIEKQKQEKLAKLEEKRKEQEIIEKAKADGKRVEMVWDNDTKTNKPMIIEEKPNA